MACMWKACDLIAQQGPHCVNTHFRVEQRLCHSMGMLTVLVLGLMVPCKRTTMLVPCCPSRKV
jgi:hypothetical protein